MGKPHSKGGSRRVPVSWVRLLVVVVSRDACRHRGRLASLAPSSLRRSISTAEMSGSWRTRCGGFNSPLLAFSEQVTRGGRGRIGAMVIGYGDGERTVGADGEATLHGTPALRDCYRSMEVD